MNTAKKLMVAYIAVMFVRMIKTSFLIGFAIPTYLFVRLVFSYLTGLVIARRKREEAKFLYKKIKDA